jgi:hypothetical protein
MMCDNLAAAANLQGTLVESVSSVFACVAELSPEAVMFVVKRRHFKVICNVGPFVEELYEWANNALSLERKRP